MVVSLLRRVGWGGLVLPALLAVHVAAASQAEPLAYEPVALGWSADEVERATADNLTALVQRAERAGQLGCSRYCERLELLFARLVAVARVQTERSRRLNWSLTVVQLPDVAAMAMPDGQVVVSETFIDEAIDSDEALAFVLAHEMAHSILEHERQALSFARLLLPQRVQRSVRDMYVEMDFNLALVKAMEPVMQQGEFEADELGLLLASVAGYAPERQLAFIEREAARDPGPTPLVSTHPSAVSRLALLRERLPWAQRLMPVR